MKLPNAIDVALAMIDDELAASWTATGPTRGPHLANARSMVERLAEGLRARRTTLDHAEADLARLAGQP